MANLKKIILFLILNIIILSNSHAEWEKFLSIEERNLDIFLDRQKVIGSHPKSEGGTIPEYSNWRILSIPFKK